MTVENAPPLSLIVGPVWENRNGPSGDAPTSRPGPDHLPFANNERG